MQKYPILDEEHNIIGMIVIQGMMITYVSKEQQPAIFENVHFNLSPMCKPLKTITRNECNNDPHTFEVKVTEYLKSIL